jgi:protein-L-isoaspartate(D-aspartate) O-methyltransferase
MPVALTFVGTLVVVATAAHLVLGWPLPIALLTALAAAGIGGGVAWVGLQGRVRAQSTEYEQRARRRDRWTQEVEPSLRAAGLAKLADYESAVADLERQKADAQRLRDEADRDDHDAAEAERSAAPLGSRREELARLEREAPSTDGVAVPARAETYGGDVNKVRLRMAERLSRSGFAEPALIAAFTTVPRHQFVDAGLATQAYEDTSLPIGHGQTISKPSVVARMLELLLGGANARRAGNLGAVLEIGTGCGYQAALLCELAGRVISVERLKPLHDKARALLAPMRSHKLRLVFGDGMLGHAPGAPYDSIIAAAGGASIPEAWLEQLAVGGRLVSPVEQSGGGQALIVIDRREDGYDRRLHEAVRFVPLKSGVD